MGNDFVFFGFVLPTSIPERTFGLGEREGSFFLKDKTKYSLITNANNV